jgi:hypothetical protein
VMVFLFVEFEAPTPICYLWLPDIRAITLLREYTGEAVSEIPAPVFVDVFPGAFTVREFY